MAKDLIIDGIALESDPDKTLLEVARELGIHIPTLCFYKDLSPYAACRICVVEVIWRGKSRLRTACTYPAWEGEVKTDSQRVRKARKLILELMLAEAPEAVEIKEMAKEYGANPEKHNVHRIGNDNKCIACGLCVRICKERMNIGAIGFKNRGQEREITTPFDKLSDVCSTCGACSFVCPTDAIRFKYLSEKKVTPILSEFNKELIRRPVIYTPFPQAVPNVPVIDKEKCMHFLNKSCRICESVCESDAIRYQQEDEIIEEEVGAVVMATGYDLYDLKKLPEFGSGKLNDVVDGLTFERILSSSGPSSGKVFRPSDNKEPKTIVFIKCAGSRDPENHNAYCSKICCMYSTKHAMLYKHRVPDGKAYIFYMDVRTGGKRYEEFYQRAQEEEGVIYLRGKVSKLYNEDGKVVVSGVDTLLGRNIEIRADLVVLATSILPTAGTTDIANLVKTQIDENGFLNEAHPKMRPVESMSAGIYLSGCGHGPKDIPETVAQASAAANMVCKLFANEFLLHEPIITGVDLDVCSGCGVCVEVCPYNARELNEARGVVNVNKVLCEGCGACAVACVSGAARQNNYTDAQINEMVQALLV